MASNESNSFCPQFEYLAGLGKQTSNSQSDVKIIGRPGTSNILAAHFPFIVSGSPSSSSAHKSQTRTLQSESDELTNSFLKAVIPDIPMLSRAEIDAIQLNRARRMAKRTRTEAACRPCKSKRARCSDARPCPRCVESYTEAECVNAGGGRSLVNPPDRDTRGSNKRSASSCSEAHSATLGDSPPIAAADPVAHTSKSTQALPARLAARHQVATSLRIDSDHAPLRHSRRLGRR